MATNVARISRPTKKLEKPRPLNMSTQNRHSIIDARLGTVEEIMALTDTVASCLASGNYDRNLKSNIKNLHSVLKTYGSKLEVIYKDQLDRSFVTFRNGCRDDALDYVSRIHLLELIELRAMQWASQDNQYYKHKTNHELDIVTTPVLENSFSQSSLFSQITPIGPVAAPPQLLLGPGELVKSSGKYPAPTRVIGKNYCKDEVVIRNSDSGKVNPGAKERLVQITGPVEEKINYAKQLMEETIRRNASPVRADGELERPESSSSLNTDSDDSLLPHNTGGGRSALLHSFSTNDASLGEYKYTVTVGDDSLKITGTNLDLVRIAKLVLDEYFTPDTNEQYGEFAFEEGQEVFEHIDPHPYLATQDSEESEETYKAQTQNAAQQKTGIKTEGDASLEKNRNSPKQTKAGAGLRYYTPEEIIRFADSLLSRQTPPNWAVVSRDCPTILRKTPIEWVDAVTLLSRRPQEGDTIMIKTAAVTPPPIHSSVE